MNYPNYATEAAQGDFSHASGTYEFTINSGNYYIQNIGYTVSDNTIYTLSSFTRPTYAHYTNSYYDLYWDNFVPAGPIYTDTPTVTSYIFVNFDAYSGSVITSKVADIPSGLGYIGAKLANKGDHLLAYSVNGMSINYYEFDRNGNLLTNGSSQPASAYSTGTYSKKDINIYSQPTTAPPYPFACYWGSTDMTYASKDDRGNIYYFANLICQSTIKVNYNGNYGYITLDSYFNPEAPSGLYLMKFDVGSWTITSLGRTGGPSTSFTDTGYLNAVMDNHAMIVPDPFTGRVYTRTFHTYYTGLVASPTNSYFYDAIGMNGEGVIGGPGLSQWPANTGFHFAHDGTIQPGWCTPTASGGCDVFNNSGGVYLENVSGSSNYSARAYEYTFGQYFGDGFFVAGYTGKGGSGVSTYDSNRYFFVYTGPVSTNESYKGFHLGQFVSTDTTNDSEFTFSLQMNDPTLESTLVGFSFRMQDPKNRYAVETDGSTLYLSRYIGGNRVILASQPYAFDTVTYKFKIKVLGDQIDVWMNDIPVFHDIHDGTFLSGKFGPFTEKSSVGFSGISNKIVVDLSQWLTGYAILDEGQAVANVQYPSINFTDPENDPIAGNYQWSISHTPKFINNTGYSIYNGQH